MSKQTGHIVHLPYLEKEKCGVRLYLWCPFASQAFIVLVLFYF